MFALCHFRTPAPQYSGPLSDHLIGVMPLRDPPALPRAPHRGRETRLAGRHLVRPNDDLFAVLPLDRYRFVSGLVAALIDGEIAKDRLRLEGQQGFPQLFRVETTSPPHGIYQKLAPGICPCRLDRRSVA